VGGASGAGADREGVFDEHMPTPNQISVKREDVTCTGADLLAVPTATITEAGCG
jgi:malate synthase